MADVLRFLLVTADRDCKHVLVERVPDDAGDHLRGLRVFGVRPLLAVAQQRQVGVVRVVLVVDEELLQICLLLSLVVEQQLSEHFVQR